MVVKVFGRAQVRPLAGKTSTKNPVTSSAVSIAQGRSSVGQTIATRGLHSVTKQFIHISTPFVLGLYAALSAVWIIVGDILLRRFAAAGTQPLGWETAKGLLFVALSAGVLGWFGVQRDRADARNRLRARELHESDERYRA